MSEESTQLIVEIDGHIARLRLDGPARRNAIGLRLSDRIKEVLAELSEDRNIRAISLTGSGDIFCAGIDLKESNDRAGRGISPIDPTTQMEPTMFESFLTVGKPTLAVLNGPAVGAGCELAIGADLRIAASHATFMLPESKRGMGANFASAILPRLLPRGIALEMLYTGEPMDATTALGWGLLNRVVPAAELEDAADRMLQSIVTNAPLSQQRQKGVAVGGWSLPVEKALRVTVDPDPYASRDREEGVRAFVEKREPRWEAR